MEAFRNHWAGCHRKCVYCETVFRLDYEGSKEQKCPDCRLKDALADLDAEGGGE